MKIKIVEEKRTFQVQVGLRVVGTLVVNRLGEVTGWERVQADGHEVKLSETKKVLESAARDVIAAAGFGRAGDGESKPDVLATIELTKMEGNHELVATVEDLK